MSVARPFLALQTLANITTKTIPASNLSHLFQLVQNNKTFLKASMGFPAEPVPLPALAALFQPIYMDYEAMDRVLGLLYIFSNRHRLDMTLVYSVGELWVAYVGQLFNSPQLRIEQLVNNSPQLRASMLKFGQDGLKDLLAGALEVFHSSGPHLSNEPGVYPPWCEFWNATAAGSSVQRGWQWPIDCATHPNSGYDEAMAEALQKFKFMPSFDVFDVPDEAVMPERYLEYSVPEVAAALDKLLHGSLEGRTQFDKFYGGESYAKPTFVELHSIIREFKRIAIDCVEVWIKYGPNHPNWALGVRIGKDKILQHIKLRYHANPYSDVPLRVRLLMAEVDYEGLFDLFFNCDEWFSSPPSMDDVYEIGYLLCKAIMMTAIDFDDEAFSKVEKDGFHIAYRSNWFDEPMNRRSFPPGDWRIISNIFDHLPEIPLTGLDVPLQLTGPPIDPFQVASVHISIPTENSCPICLEPFEEAPMRLNACSHFLHNGCLAGLINSLQTDSPDYKCPLCRSSICEVRSYKAVLGSRLET